MSSLSSRLEAAGTTPWPTDDLLLRLANANEFVSGLGDLNVDSSEPPPTPEDIRHAASQEQQLVQGLLDGGTVAIQAALKKNVGPAAMLEASLAKCQETKTGVVNARHPNDMLATLADARRSKLLVLVGFGSDGGWINVAPALLNLAKPQTWDKLTQPEVEPVYRFYMNPQLRDVPAVATQIVLANQSKQAVFHFKFSEAYARELDQRADKIVVYAPKSEASQVFDILQAIKADMPQAFKGRKLPGLAYQIDEGIGFAVEPEGPSSYTQVAGNLLNQARHEAGNLSILTDPAKIHAMRSAVARLALSEGMNPHNIALPRQR